MTLCAAPARVFKEVVVSYQASDMVVEVLCTSPVQELAVQQFAKTSGFTCPASKDARPRYNCNAKTHGNGEVLW